MVRHGITANNLGVTRQQALSIVIMIYAMLASYSNNSFVIEQRPRQPVPAAFTQ